MLTKTKLRSLEPRPVGSSPRAGLRVLAEPGEWTGPLAGKEVDVCVIPCYGPRYDSEKYFHWNYRAAYRIRRLGVGELLRPRAAACSLHGTSA